MYQITPTVQPTIELLPQDLQEELDLIKNCASSLTGIDPATEKVLKPLEVYRKLRIGHLADASMDVDKAQSTVTFNRNFFDDIVHQVSKAGLQQKDLNSALIIFILHELTHISQGVKYFEYVQNIKKVDLSEGRERMAKWDLEADWLAAHTLSLFKTKTQNGEYNEKIYLLHFHRHWCVIGRAMLIQRPSSSRTDKLQRTFGHLLMSALIKEAYSEDRPRPFNGELFPKWSQTFDNLRVESNGKNRAADSVSPFLMRQALNYIKKCKYDEAEDKILHIYQQLPSR